MKFLLILNMEPTLNTDMDSKVFYFYLLIFQIFFKFFLLISHVYKIIIFKLKHTYKTFAICIYIFFIIIINTHTGFEQKLGFRSMGKSTQISFP